MFNNTHNKGFTLVEMVVSMALFVVVAVVAIGALLRVLDANKKSESIKTAITNINFALESMTREMRVGSHYNCSMGTVIPSTPLNSQSCSTWITSGPWTLAFQTSISADAGGGNTCQLVNVYQYDGTKLLKGEQETCGGSITLYPIIYSTTNANDSQLNDSSITFTTAGIKVINGSGIQPYGQFHFVGTAGVKVKLQSSFDIQASVSQRLPE